MPKTERPYSVNNELLLPHVEDRKAQRRYLAQLKEEARHSDRKRNHNGQSH